MNKFQVKKFLSNLVAINTSNPPGNETRVAEFIAKFLKKRSQKVELVGPKKRKNIIAFFGNLKSDSIFLFNGHLDTVPFTKNDWRSDPLKLVGKDGYFYGRGAADMKGGIAASIFAILEGERLGYLKNKQVIFAGSADEETGANSKLGSKLVVEYLTKNKIRVKGALIPEPSNNKDLFTIYLGHRGLIWIKAKSFGKPTHAGFLEADNGAITKMRRFIESAGKLFPKEPKKIRGIPQNSMRVTFIKSGNSCHYNKVPASCEANFDIRVSPKEDNNRLIAKLKVLAETQGIKLKIIKNTPSSGISKKEKIVKVLEDVLRSRNGKFKHGFASPTCDAHHYIKTGIPTVNGLGPVGINIHAPDEGILEKSLFDRIDIFTELIRKF